MATSSLPALERTEIDGIPVVWTDAGSGPFVAALSFRVGRADEPPAQAGISHVVEHLALTRLGVQDYDHNGFVDATRTVFHSVGSTDDAIGFMAAVADGLAEPPLARLGIERRMLRSEHDQQGPSLGGAMRLFRFGFRGHGLVGEDELGLAWLGPDRVTEWIAQRFTRHNAALWLSGPPPAGLRVRLADGRRHPAPPVEPIATVTFPAHHTWNGPGVTLAFLVPRQPGSNMMVNIAHRRARQRLRYDKGLIYDVSVDYEPLDGRTAHVTLGAECPDDKLPVVRDALLAVLDELASVGPTQEELDLEVSGFARQFDDRDAVIGYLDAAVVDLLFGNEPVPPQELYDRRRAVDPAGAAAILRGALGSILVVAGGEPLPPDRATHYPEWSSDEVAGREYGPAGFFLPGRRPKERLIAGPEGVTLRLSATERATVRYRDCVAVTHDSPFERELWGHDGFRVPVVGALWKNGDDLVAAIDAAIPPELVACDEHGVGALPEEPEEA